MKKPVACIQACRHDPVLLRTPVFAASVCNQRKLQIATKAKLAGDVGFILDASPQYLEQYSDVYHRYTISSLVVSKQRFFGQKQAMVTANP